jgi:hypothetical protein
VRDSTCRFSLKTVEATMGGAPSLRIRPSGGALYSLALEKFSGARRHRFALRSREGGVAARRVIVSTER